MAKFKYSAEPIPLADEGTMWYTVNVCPVCGESLQDVPNHEIFSYNAFEDFGGMTFLYHTTCSDTPAKDNILDLFKQLETQIKSDLEKEK
jgi:hypothetical protein